MVGVVVVVVMVVVVVVVVVLNAWVKVFRIICEFRILRLTFYRQSASKC